MATLEQGIRLGAMLKTKKNHCRRKAGEAPAEMTLELRAEGCEGGRALRKSRLCHREAAREKKALAGHLSSGRDMMPEFVGQSPRAFQEVLRTRATFFFF